VERRSLLHDDAGCWRVRLKGNMTSPKALWNFFSAAKPAMLETV
jgi:hypothetical protein